MKKDFLDRLRETVNGWYKKNPSLRPLYKAFIVVVLFFYHIAMHFYNNGISDSYSMYRLQHFKMNRAMWKHLFVQIGVLCKKWMQHIIQPNDLKTYFAYKQHQGNVRFFMLLMKPEFRKEIRKENVYNG